MSAGLQLDHGRKDCQHTLMANRSPVALFLARYTLPKAPLLMGFRISKSLMLMLAMLLPELLVTGVEEPAASWRRPEPCTVLGVCDMTCSLSH